MCTVDFDWGMCVPAPARSTRLFFFSRWRQNAVTFVTGPDLVLLFVCVLARRPDPLVPDSVPDYVAVSFALHWVPCVPLCLSLGYRYSYMSPKHKPNACKKYICLTCHCLALTRASMAWECCVLKTSVWFRVSGTLWVSRPDTPMGTRDTKPHACVFLTDIMTFFCRFLSAHQ